MIEQGLNENYENLDLKTLHDKYIVLYVQITFYTSFIFKLFSRDTFAAIY